MRINIKFSTAYGIDHKLYGFDLIEIRSDEWNNQEFVYSAKYYGEVPENIQKLLNSDIVIRMEKEIEIKRHETELGKSIKLKGVKFVLNE